MHPILARNRTAWAGALLLAGLSAWLYRDTLALPPSFHHAWAQADWLALALNFRQRGFDFFHPATYNLLTRDGVTGAGFPVPAYLAGLLMALTGSEAPGQMRLVTLLCSLGGLLALGGLVFRARPSPIRAGLAVLFAFCSPIYGYYQANYLPSVPAFAAALAGYYCFYRYCEPGGAGRWLYAAVAALALATAMRTPFAVPLLATLLHTAARLAARPGAPPGRWRAGLAFGLALGFLAGYFLYNEHLTRAYGGSMFLARPLPYSDAAAAWAGTRFVADKWGLDLLSAWQWGALAAVLPLALLSRHPRAWLRSEWAAHWLLLATGGALYYLLMGPQYVDHDYYFIDSLLLPLVLLFAGGVAGLSWPAGRAARWTGAALAAGLAGVWLNATHTVQARRYTPQPDDRGLATLANFTGTARLLDSLGVARSARITVFDAYSYNLPLLLMQRRGWTVLTTTEDNLRAGFAEPADYIITQNAFLRSDVTNNYPLLLERMDSAFSNGRLTLWRPRRRPVPVVWEVGTDLESPLDPAVWENAGPATISSEQAASGQYASRLDAGATHGLTFARPAGALRLRAHDRLVVRARCWLPPGDYAARLAVSLEPPGGGPAYFWQALDCRRYQGPPGRWTTVGGTFRLPAPHTPQDVFKVCLLKEGAATVFLDDLRLTLVR